MKPLLVAWDFHGVLDVFGEDVAGLLKLVLEHGGENIVVSHSERPFIEAFLQARSLAAYFTNVYGMYQHHGRLEQFKVAALLGHVADAGPYEYCLMIGDTIADIDAGTSAGFVTCLYDPHAQFGHVQQADYRIQALAEVRDLLPV